MNSLSRKSASHWTSFSRVRSKQIGSGLYAVTKEANAKIFMPFQRPNLKQKTEESIPEPYSETLSREAEGKSSLINHHSLSKLSMRISLTVRAILTALVSGQSRLLFCGRDESCKRERRAAVSAAFLTAPEFEKSAFLIYRIYRAALARAHPICRV